MSEAEVIDFNIPTAVPLCYELDDRLNFIKKYYLMDPDEVAKKIAAVANQGKVGGGGNKPFARLIFSRHGESEWNVANKFTGWVDVDLSVKGVDEAKGAGKLL